MAAETPTASPPSILFVDDAPDIGMVLPELLEGGEAAGMLEASSLARRSPKRISTHFQGSFSGQFRAPLQ